MHERVVLTHNTSGIASTQNAAIIQNTSPAFCGLCTPMNITDEMTVHDTSTTAMKESAAPIIDHMKAW